MTRIVLSAALGCAVVAAGFSLAAAAETSLPVSFHREIRPLFQAQCQGCHQPGQPLGGYVMTSFEGLLKAGESGTAGIVPGAPEQSYLLQQITPNGDGQAEMPKGRKTLAPTEIARIKQWITEGAIDDSPPHTRPIIDAAHPPAYRQQPLVSGMDYAPDGRLLAVTGFHEVLLLQAETGEPAGRLVGFSERVQSVAFSPDGTKLAVAAGNPGRMGEIQVWDVAAHQQLLSAPYTFDTLYGVSWSPDGMRLAFGCADNSVRAIDAKTGEQLLFSGSHNDWALDTVFSKDGTHLASVGRDMTAKLIEFETQRFVDNITSITPGALKGGISAVTRHPERDEIVIGGADGIPKVYRMHRLVQRVIGDDSNIIRQLPGMTGRINDLAVSRDGKRIVAVSSLDGKSEVAVFGYEFDTALPDDIKAIMAKATGGASGEELAKLAQYKTTGVQEFFRKSLPMSLYAVAFHPVQPWCAIAGADGIVRVLERDTGHAIREFPVAPLMGQPAAPARDAAPTLATNSTAAAAAAETWPTGLVVASLELEPTAISISDRYGYAQLLLTAVATTGQRVDVTRLAGISLDQPVVRVSPEGKVTPLRDGVATLTLSVQGKSLAVPVAIAGSQIDRQVDFIQDVNPVLSRLGCNQGTCHGAQAGKAGFKLSLRGYDPIYDLRALTDDLAGRRVNFASPDDSLMLLKPTGNAPHVGGVLMQENEPYHQILKNWIANGTRLDLSVPRVTKIAIMPEKPAIELAGSRQQMRVVASYSDGRTRDVTHEAFIESGNTEVATTSGRGGLLTAVRRGEAPILARYEGAYAAATLTVMGDRAEFAWTDFPANNRIDELTAAKWRQMKILPSELCTDTEFLRRVTLDLTGLPPSAEQVRAFVNDARDTRTKRDELVDKLVGSEPYVEHWANKWADLLQVNGKFLGRPGAQGFRKWIREKLAANTPYDQFVREIVTAEGSTRDTPQASYYKILREPTATMENTTHLFLGVRFNCNKCHDHPFERWTQDQYYETAAYFAQVSLSRDNNGENPNIGGTAVEGAKPMYEVVKDAGQGELKHDRTKADTPPKFPYGCDHNCAEGASRRVQLATWMTAPTNPYFARSYANRLWGYMFGVGIMEPIDDLRAGNPATNPELMDFLTQEFVHSQFNVQHMLKLICKSRTYQLSVKTNRWNEDDKTNYSHALARRLSAETLYDSMHAALGAPTRIPGMPVGSRAAAIPDSEIELPSGFLATFGRPPRESACECERTGGMQLGPVMALISGPTIADAIADGENDLPKLVSQFADDRELMNELYLRVLGRAATSTEIEQLLAEAPRMEADDLVITAKFAEREAYYAPIRERLTQAREAAVAKATAELEQWKIDLVPIQAQREQDRLARIATSEKAVADYAAGPLVEKLKEAQAKQSFGTLWQVLEPKAMTSTNAETKFAVEKDGSVFVSGPSKIETYTIESEITQQGLTAFRLEALLDDRLPNRGPGRSPNNGNFVVTEFAVTAVSVQDPTQQQPLKLKNAVADYNQGSYDPPELVDGELKDAGNGWAIGGQVSRLHWVTMEAAEPFGFAGGTRLVIQLHQAYVDGGHSLGKFRVAVTQAALPVGLGSAGRLAELASIPAESRTPQQTELLLAEFEGQDSDAGKLKGELLAARKPVPKDSKLQQLEDQLAVASKPVPLDAILERLRSDHHHSQQQLAQKRLTMAQDVVWALINSPAFLFNR